ncbi:alpha/beta hydrolase [Streptomyces tsukubensis]|uniref:alpha/beta hydrolase n=1 Tax=Streptomyces tsukubensis TaxID=83656 RepID=UPI003450EBB3
MNQETTFRALDGTALSGTFLPAGGSFAGAVVLVHGSGVTREEGGFFTRLATALAEAGVASLRFDLRAHGSSAGREEELTIAAVANDVRAAGEHVNEHTGRSGPVHVIAASFAGGAAALHAARRPDSVGKLVLLNPRLDYKERYVTPGLGWSGDRLTPDSARSLDERGFTDHSPFALGRALLNEVFHLDAEAIAAEVRAPVLMVHGTGDTFVPVESSRRFRPLFGGGAELMELEGAQHGFAVHDDPSYAEPQTRNWQRQVVSQVCAFLTS